MRRRIISSFASQQRFRFGEENAAIPLVQLQDADLPIMLSYDGCAILPKAMRLSLSVAIPSGKHHW